VDTAAGSYAGSCLFRPEGRGSFTVQRAGNRNLIADVVSISVMLTDRGQGDVRGATSDGVVSRWGPVRRDRKDKACWKGSDFRICAY